MIETLAHIRLSELAEYAAAALAILACIVQISPIKINPWSWIARKIGRAINSEVLEEVNQLKEDVEKMRDAEDERNAKAARIRILHFGDELLHEVRHSKEHFDEILQAITEYNQYCDEHPDFKNHMTTATTAHILSTYKKCMEDRTFL